MKKLLFILILSLSFISQAQLRNCNNCAGGCRLNQTCCFTVNCPEECNSYSCNGYCSNVTNPKCIYDPTCGKYICICR